MGASCPRAIGRRVVTAAAGLAALGVSLTACSNGPPLDSASGAAGMAFYRPPDPLPPAAPGTVIRAQRLPGDGGLPAGTTVDRVLYHSRSPSGADIPVSGLVAIPSGPPPSGGFPIVAWAHGTTGAADPCAPSMQKTVGDLEIAQLVRHGMVVAATDYPGLGTPGIHPYLVGASEGRSVLDGARAARSLAPDETSDQVVIAGQSQGGHAALFAGQLASSYAPELKVAGIVAAAPVASPIELLPVVPTASPDANVSFGITALVAWSETYADLPLTTALLPAIAHQAQLLVTQSCTIVVAATFNQTPTDQIIAPSWSTQPALQARITQNEPGHAPTASPILIVQGTADTTIPPSGTEAMVAQLCDAQHDTVALDLYPGVGHTDIGPAAGPRIAAWIEARLAGQHAPSTCASGPATVMAS